jgi:hypothetical protein
MPERGLRGIRAALDQQSTEFGDLLKSLAFESKSSVVILRTIDARSRTLELVDRAIGPDAPQVPRDWAAAQSKTFECWGSDDPAGAWGAASRSVWLPCLSGYYTPEEQRLIDWIQEKAWFPVQLEDEKLLVVLLRGEQQPFSIEDVSRTWLLAQSSLSQELQSAPHQNFVQALDVLDSLDGAGPDEFGSATLLGLASHFGLGWNRAWLLVESDKPSRAGSFGCFAAMGELTKDRWSDAIFVPRQHLSNLAEEFRRFYQQGGWKQDQLWQTCAGDQPLYLSPSVPSGTAKQNGESKSDQFEFSMLSQLDEGEGNILNDQIAAHIRGQGFEYCPTDRLWNYPFQVRGRRFLALLAQPYTWDAEARSALLTSLFIQHALTIAATFDADDWIKRFVSSKLLVGPAHWENPNASFRKLLT